MPKWVPFACRFPYLTDGHIVVGILTQVWVSELSGKIRARVVDFHSDRHTFITNLYKANISPKTA